MTYALAYNLAMTIKNTIGLIAIIVNTFCNSVIFLRSNQIPFRIDRYSDEKLGNISLLGDKQPSMAIFSAEAGSY